MIGLSQSDVAKKYAHAYLNVFADQHSFEEFCSMWRAAQFLSEHHSLLFYLSLPMIQEVDKKRFIDLFFEKFHLFDSLKQLFYLLLKNKHIFLAGDTLRDIYSLYKIKHNISDLHVTASSDLSEEKIEEIKNFFTKLSGQQVVVRYSVNQALIAGIRLQTESFLWEYSIAQQLRKIKQELIA
ncbi:ATP synthase F1 subunit delta [Candidatus Babeliales bacterium]|nr:ATP synthase F1 subunit delta [Candidatus Babeliales bacterium]MBP9844269.1 ATP synthase F1 subunit delta [Candidatus Babeliales bacterium]